MATVTLNDGSELSVSIFSTVWEALTRLYGQRTNVPFYELFRLCTIDGYQVLDPRVRTILLNTALVNSFTRQGEGVVPGAVKHIVELAAVEDPDKPGGRLLVDPTKR